MNEVIGIKQPLINQISYVYVNRQFEIGDFVLFDTGKGEFLYECVVSNVAYNRYAHAIFEGKSVRLATVREVEKYMKIQQEAERFDKLFNSMLKEQKIDAAFIGTQIAYNKDHVRFVYFSTNSLRFPAMIKYLLTNSHRRIKIEFYQVGEREYYALNGGVGVCGYELCCHSRSYKTPNITTNSLRSLGITVNMKMGMSGTCGKYKCCLLFDHKDLDAYKQVLPDVDSVIEYKSQEHVVTQIDFKRNIVIAVGTELVEIEFEYFLKGTNDSN